MRKILYISLGVIGVIALALFAMIFSQKTPEQTKWFATSETLSVSSEVAVTYESSVAASQEQEKKDIAQYNLALEKMVIRFFLSIKKQNVKI
jgi:sensor histidine kinase regulating citrate/malate metabolism